MVSIRFVDTDELIDIRYDAVFKAVNRLEYYSSKLFTSQDIRGIAFGYRV